MRPIGLTLLAAATLTTLGLVAPALTAARQAPDPLDCRAEWSDRGERHCELREQTLPGGTPIEVDAGSNGGVSVRGASRSDVFVRARVVSHAATEAAARELASTVRIVTANGRISADGPATDGREWWAVTFEVEVPQGTALTLNTRNGGVALSRYTGAARLYAVNGPVRLTDVNGDIRGETRNGPVVVDLTGARWEGMGLHVDTRNGPVRMTLPQPYSAELEVETVNGPMQLDYPLTMDTGRFGRRSNRINTRLGDGGARIRATTVNGPVTVSRR